VARRTRSNAGGRVELCDLLAGFVDPEIEERLYAEMTGGDDVRLSFEEARRLDAVFADLVAIRRKASSQPGPHHPEQRAVARERKSKMSLLPTLEGYMPDFSPASRRRPWAPLLVRWRRDRAAAGARRVSADV